MSLILCAILVPHIEKERWKKNQRKATKVVPGSEMVSIQRMIKEARALPSGGQKTERIHAKRDGGISSNLTTRGHEVKLEKSTF